VSARTLETFGSPIRPDFHTFSNSAREPVADQARVVVTWACGIEIVMLGDRHVQIY
jgi:hypothetical protein